MDVIVRTVSGVVAGHAIHLFGATT